MRYLIGLVLLFSFSLASVASGQRLQPQDFEYIGAFAIDADYSTGGNVWNGYGLRGMGFDSTGDPGNGDAFAGSLWVTGHDYERWVFELSIPTPSASINNFDQLPRPDLLTEPMQFTNGCTGDMELFAGVEVHGNHLWGSCLDMYNVTGGDKSTVLWRRNLSDLSNLQGPFHAGPLGVSEFHSNRQGMYVLSIPDDWAAAHLGGRNLATGLSRNAHGGAMGPTILAFDPDNPSDGYDLLWYRHRHNEPNENCYADQNDCDYPEYTACDKWHGATWVRTGGSDTVLMSGEKYDGGSSIYVGGGWDCGEDFGEIIFYDADDLAARVDGTLEPWEVVPYQTWRPAELWDASHAFGGIAFDQASGHLYVIEKGAGSFGRAIIHVYSTEGVGDVDHTLTVDRIGAGIGTVTSNPGGINCGSDCQQTYNRGTAIQLTATPGAGAYFAGWSGDADCSDGGVTLWADRDCTARFEPGAPPTHTLTISKTGSGTGTVTSSPAGINCGGDCSHDYTEGTNVQLDANPDPNHYFAGWGGSADCDDGQLVMNSGRACTAQFEEADTDSGLVAAYGFNEGGGLTAMDSSGNGHNGTLVNGPGWTEDPAIEFDGDDDYIDLGTFDAGGTALTLAAWFNANDLANCSSDDCRLISKSTSTAEDAHYFMLSTHREGSSTRLRFRLKTNGVTKTLVASSGHLLEGQWTHAAAVYDGSEMRLYQDGELVGSTAKSGTISTSDSVSVWIGGNPTSPTAMPWQGIIDEVRLYNRALTVNEIRALPPPGGDAGLFRDGFESGELSFWDNSVP